MADRRFFLRGLASLPLIGGGVTLIGNPTAAAVPVTPHLLDTYTAWLDLERSWLDWERYGPDGRGERVWCDPNMRVVWQDPLTKQCWRSTPAMRCFDHRNAVSRAAVILSAAGMPLRELLADD